MTKSFVKYFRGKVWQLLTGPLLCELRHEITEKFNFLVEQDDILLEDKILFLEDCDEVKHKQFCVPKNLWWEVFFHLQKSETARNFDTAKTVEGFGERFFS